MLSCGDIAVRVAAVIRNVEGLITQTPLVLRLPASNTDIIFQNKERFRSALSVFKVSAPTIQRRCASVEGSTQ